MKFCTVCEAAIAHHRIGFPVVSTYHTALESLPKARCTICNWIKPLLKKNEI